MAYSPVYSRDFIWYSHSFPSNAYDVAPGYTAVIREIDCYIEAGDVFLGAYASPSPALDEISFASLGGLGTNKSYQWTGRVVVPGGGRFGFYITELGEGDSAYMGGYILTNTIS